MYRNQHNEIWDSFSHNPEQKTKHALFAAQGAARDLSIFRRNHLLNVNSPQPESKKLSSIDSIFLDCFTHPMTELTSLLLDKTFRPKVIDLNLKPFKS